MLNETQARALITEHSNNCPCCSQPVDPKKVKKLWDSWNKLSLEKQLQAKIATFTGVTLSTKQIKHNLNKENN